MARISMLFSLALVLAIGSVSAHPSNHKKTQKTLCPPTLAGLQTFPSVEIIKHIEKKAKSAPNTVQFNTLFAICKTYSEQLAGFKVAGVKNVIGVIHAKNALITKAMFAAQAAVGIEGELAVKLEKSYTAMAGYFVELEEKIAEISAKYKFNANAVISKGDKAKIEKCLIKLKGSINVFVKVISQCTKKFSAEKKIGVPVVPGGGFIGAFLKNSAKVGGNLIGLGAHGQAEAESKAGAKVGGHAGAKVGGHAGGKVGAQGKAKVGGHAGGLFGGFLGFGGRVQYDAAGKGKIGGGSEFRPLSHPHKKH